MARKRNSAEQIVSKLREADAIQSVGGTAADAARKLGVSENTLYRWRARHGDIDGVWQLLPPNGPSRRASTSSRTSGREQPGSSRSIPSDTCASELGRVGHLKRPGTL
jgi:transposase-like protein